MHNHARFYSHQRVVLLRNILSVVCNDRVSKAGPKPAFGVSGARKKGTEAHILSGCD